VDYRLSIWNPGRIHYYMIHTRREFEQYLMIRDDFDTCMLSLSTSMTSQDRNSTSATFYILAAHGGAGYHPPASDSSLKCSLREAISSALTAFSGTTTASDTASSGASSSESFALDAVTTVMAALEDAPDFNAGYGSNLTFDGDVECDASLMSIEEEANDRGDYNASSSSSPPYTFGSVGAVRGVRNPVLLARRVLEGRRRRPGATATATGLGPGPGPGLGRVPPLMLVGEGATQFAKEQGLRVVVDRAEEMVAPRARREWRVWRERWERCCCCREGNDRAGISGSEEGPRDDDDDGDADAGGQQRDRDVGVRSGSSPGGREEVEMMTPRARVGSGGGDDGRDGSDANAEPLRARQDTVGAVVLVGEAGDVRRQVAAGVSRCVSCSR